MFYYNIDEKLEIWKFQGEIESFVCDKRKGLITIIVLDLQLNRIEFSGHWHVRLSRGSTSLSWSVPSCRGSVTNPTWTSDSWLDSFNSSGVHREEVTSKHWSTNWKGISCTLVQHPLRSSSLSHSFFIPSWNLNHRFQFK